MDFSLTEEQKLFRQTVRQFTLEKLLPNYSCWDCGERFEKSALTELATPRRFTLFHASIPPARTATERKP